MGSTCVPEEVYSGRQDAETRNRSDQRSHKAIEGDTTKTKIGIKKPVCAPLQGDVAIEHMQGEVMMQTDTIKTEPIDTLKVEPKMGKVKMDK